MNDKSHLLNISNLDCLTVEFIKEKNVLETGFRCWLCNEANEVTIDKAIQNKTILKIYWPDCNISSASNLKNSLKKSNFEVYSVRVLAQGSKYENSHNYK